MAIILVGDDPASLLYIQRKEKAAREIGLGVKKHILGIQATEKEILDLIASLNQNKQIDGILVQMPLPKNMSDTWLQTF